MDFPDIDLLADSLRWVNENTSTYDSEGVDVRLQVCATGQWFLHYGDASYDQDHRGYWGAGSVPGDSRPFNAYALARELIAQAREQHAQDQD